MFFLLRLLRRKGFVAFCLVAAALTIGYTSGQSQPTEKHNPEQNDIKDTLSKMSAKDLEQHITGILDHNELSDEQFDTVAIALDQLQEKTGDVQDDDQSQNERLTKLIESSSLNEDAKKELVRHIPKEFSWNGIKDSIKMALSGLNNWFAVFGGAVLTVGMIFLFLLDP